MTSTVFCIGSMVLLAAQAHALLHSKRSPSTHDESLDQHQSFSSQAMLMQLQQDIARDIPRAHKAVGSEAETQVNDLKNKYLKLLEDALTGTLTDEAGACAGGEGGCSKTKKYDPVLRERGQDWPPYGVTMVGHMRMRNVRMAIEDIVKNNVPGDFAELGAWRGGASIWAKALFNLEGQKDRKVHMFDLWAPHGDLYGTAQSYIAVQQQAVVHNFVKYNMLDDNVLFHKGLFRDTIPDFATTNPDVNFAVLRIDANYYDSYQDALYYFYPKVPVGGYIIFDDVYQDPEISGQAWRDFKSDNGVPEDLIRIDDASAYFKKTTNVPIDKSHMKPPRDANIKM